VVLFPAGTTDIQMSGADFSETFSRDVWFIVRTPKICSIPEKLSPKIRNLLLRDVASAKLLVYENTQKSFTRTLNR
jgi:hypothetical protein